MTRKQRGGTSIVDKIETGVATDDYDITKDNTTEPLKPTGEVEVTAQPEVELQQQPEVDVRPDVTYRELTLPMGEHIKTSQFNLNIQLDPDVSAALAQLADGLDRKRATLRDGTRVVSRRHAGRWLCEQLIGGE